MIQKHNAFILKKFNWRETSIIATFFTDGFGKMDGILKAARVTPSRFTSTFDVSSFNEIIYYRKHKGLHLVVECYLKNNYSNIRKDIKANSAADHFMELVSALLPAEEINSEIFQLTQDTLLSLEQNTADYERITRLFELHLLSMCGFRPHIEACITCQKELPEVAKFSHKLGGLLCKNCFDKDGTSQNILKGTIASMIYIQKNDWFSSLKLVLDDKIRHELKFILRNFITFHLEKRLKTSAAWPHL